MNPRADDLKAAFPIFASAPRPFHYLDNAATSQICRPALEALLRFEGEQRANVKRGVYRLADAATRAYEQARSQIAAYIGARAAREIVFTSGATLGLNTAAHLLEPRLARGDHILVSLAEHHSNLVPWQMAAQRRGACLTALPVDREGRIRIEELDRHLTPRTRIVALTHISNVTGLVTDLRPVAEAAHRVGAVLVVDGAQGPPHGPLAVRELGCDLYAFSAHKMFAATGAGVLWIREELLEQLPPFLGGGEMVARVTIPETRYAEAPRRFEAGTPPIGPVLALGAAAEWLMGLDWTALRRRERALLEKLLEELPRLSGVRLVGPSASEGRVGIVAFVVDGVHPHDVCQMLDQLGLCLRGGHHCAQPLMDAFGVEATVRASLAPYNDEEDIDALVEGLRWTIRRLR